MGCATIAGVSAEQAFQRLLRKYSPRCSGWSPECSARPDEELEHDLEQTLWVREHSERDSSQFAVSGTIGDWIAEELRQRALRRDAPRPAG